MNRIIKHYGFITCLALLLSACSGEPEVVEQIRAIKTITVSELATVNHRKFAGVVMATDFSLLSFEVAGNVATVQVDIGDKVQQGQVLSTLDPSDFKLAVKAAQADLVKARAEQVHKKIESEREQSIFDQGAGSQRQVDRTKYDFKAARAAVNFASAKLNLAKRDLDKTKLTSPYNGRIAKRMVEPHMEVKTGQSLFRIDADGSLDVRLGIPETVVHLIDRDVITAIEIPTLPGQGIKGRISEIGSAAHEANLFPVKITLIDPPVTVSPGMTADVTIPLTREQQECGYLIPPESILPIVNKVREGYVFVYDSSTSKVKKVLVHFTGGQEQMGVVFEGLSEGDIIATAGVSFLADGMTVKLMQAKT
ncbi:MAG: efflux RND transporter periplasmic adaptor subunit, partial [Methylococcales bacterium]|nr:efflux RND transporter periplasmic adaptor subunit [Methylococcales bacterium]